MSKLPPALAKRFEDPQFSVAMVKVEDAESDEKVEEPEPMEIDTKVEERAE